MLLPAVRRSEELGLGPEMLTIQSTPNWSVTMPNSSPHICFSSGMVTVPAPESFSQ